MQEADNGPKALNIARRQSPDLILLDIIMPEMDGLEVCRRLKADAATCKIPVVFLTALTATKDKLKGFQVGGVDYIGKPFATEEVFARIDIHLTIRDLQCRLRLENKRFRSLAEATLEGLLIHRQGTIIEVNQSLIKMTGYQREELIAKTVSELLPSTLNNDTYFDNSTGPEAPLEVQIAASKGGFLTAEMQARAIDWQGQSAHVIALRDITFCKALEHRTLELESQNMKLKAALGERDHLGGLIGQSMVMQNVYQRLFSIAASDETAIIYGETGTGKELAAQTVFNLSWRFTKNLIPVNCGAIPENLFESEFFGYRKDAFTGANRDTPGHFEKAQGGVLFLDEIAELSLPCQTKLLRVLNDKTYTPVGASTPRTADVRIIAATAQNLKELTRAGTMRLDFFYRIHVITLEMPPLRDHKEDIPLLVDHFINQHTPPDKNPPVIPSVIHDIFRNHNWPGNVRELFNELHRYLSNGEIELSNAISRPKAPLQKNRVALKSGSSFNASVAAYEKQLICQALKETGGNKKAAAELLQMSLATIHRKINRFGLN